MEEAAWIPEDRPVVVGRRGEEPTERWVRRSRGGKLAGERGPGLEEEVEGTGVGDDMVTREAEANAGVGKDGDLGGEERDGGSGGGIGNGNGGQGRDKRVEKGSVSGVVGGETVEDIIIGGGNGNSERDSVGGGGGAEEEGRGRGRGEMEAGGERDGEEEGAGEGELEEREGGGGEVGERVGVGVEEEGLGGREEEPRDVHHAQPHRHRHRLRLSLFQLSGGCWWTDLATLHHLHINPPHFSLCLDGGVEVALA